MFEQIKLYISNKWEKLYPLLFSSMICLLLYFFKDNEIIDKCYYKCFDKTFISALVTAESIVFGFLLTTMVTLVNTQFRAYPFYKASEWMPHKKLLLNSIVF